MKKHLRILFLLPAIALLLAWPGNSQTQHSITLTWGASSTTGAQYNVYRGTATGGPYTKQNASPVGALTYTDSSGTAGTKYFYVVTAFCASGGACPTGIVGESAFSAEASAIFLGAPSAPVGVTATAN